MKLCPLIQNRTKVRGDTEIPNLRACEKENCEWWIESDSMCAIRGLVHGLKALMIITAKEIGS